MNRRTLLKGAAGTAGVLAFAGPGSSVAVVDPITVAVMASTAISIVQSFVKRGDGLGAMLKAQYQLLTVVISQLENVQQSLGRVEEAIADLPEAVRTIVAKQYGAELITQIRGGAGNYRSFLRAYANDPNILASAGVQQQLQDILSRAADRRSTLRELDFGRGPEAAMVLPISMALEIACLSHLQFPTAIIRSRLTDYRDWIDTISDPASPGSIPTRRAQAIARHDEIITASLSNPLAARMDVGRMRLTEPTRVERIDVSPCAFLCTGDITTEGGLNGPTSLGAGRLLGSYCPGAYMGSRIVESEQDADLGVYLLKQTRLDMATTRSSASLGPRQGVRCDVKRIPSQNMIQELPSERTYAFINDFYPHLREQHWNALGATLAAANLQRAELAVGLHAEALMDHTRRQIAAFDSTLGAV